jgi:microcystin-dependent protein
MALESFIGEISIVAFNFAPRDWLPCNGQLLPISQYSALFALLGTTYGGDGHNTFALPNLNGRMPVGADYQQFQLGQMAGVRGVTLTAANLPAHVHALEAQQITANATIQPQASAGNGDTANPADAVWANVSDGLTNLHSYTQDTTQLAKMKPIQATLQAQLNAGTTGVTGQNIPVDVSNPYLALNFIICINGIFPSRP